MSEAEGAVRYNSKVVRAVRAVYAGEASAAEQVLAMKWILHDAAKVTHSCMVYGDDGRRRTDHALGAKSVGEVIVHLLDKVNLKELATKEEKEKHNG